MLDRRASKLWERSKMDSENRHDPFGDDEFLGEVAAFEPKNPDGRKPGRARKRLKRSQAV